MLYETYEDRKARINAAVLAKNDQPTKIIVHGTGDTDHDGDGLFDADGDGDGAVATLPAEKKSANAEKFPHFNPLEHRDAHGEWTADGAIGEIRSLANQVAQDHPTTGADKSLRNAALAIRQGDKKGAVNHLTDAYQKITDDPQYNQGVANDDFHQRGRSNLLEINHQLRAARANMPDTPEQKPEPNPREARNLLNDLSGSGSHQPLDFEAAMMMPPGTVPVGSIGGESEVNAYRRTKGLDMFGSYEQAKLEINAAKLARWNLPADPSEMTTKVGPEGFVHGWKFVGVEGAAHLHGKSVAGRTAQGDVVKGKYDHNTHEVVDKFGGRTKVTHVADDSANDAPKKPLPHDSGNAGWG